MNLPQISLFLSNCYKLQNAILSLGQRNYDFERYC